MSRLFCRTALISLCLLPNPAHAQSADRLESIRQRATLTCGVLPVVPGFSETDGAGRYSGLDVDICRAMSAAILGNPDKVTYVVTSTLEQFLQSRDIDVVSRRLTWSLAREGRAGVRFGPVMFYDGQSFLVPRRRGVQRVRQLSGRKICVEPGSEGEFNLGPYFRANKLVLEQVLLDDVARLPKAFETGECEAYTSDTSMLGAIRSRMPHPELFDILGEQISKEPLAQVVRQQDNSLFDVLRWTVFALINAEELGITSTNVDAMLKSDDPDVQRFLGVLPGNGAVLGLGEEWAYTVVKTMGNYGELFERNVGSRSRIKLPRGLNKLWTAGGLMYAPPAR